MLSLFKNYKILSIIFLCFFCVSFYFLWQNKKQEVKTLELNLSICSEANQASTDTIGKLNKDLKRANTLTQNRLKLKDKIIKNYKQTIQNEIEKEEKLQKRKNFRKKKKIFSEKKAKKDDKKNSANKPDIILGGLNLLFPKTNN